MRNYYKYKANVKTIKPISIIIVPICFMVFLAIGHASFSDALTISGTANVGNFSITYNLNGGTNVANPITVYYATTNAALPIPNYTGYTFGGWYENDTFTGSALTTTPTRK